MVIMDWPIDGYDLALLDERPSIHGHGHGYISIWISHPCMDEPHSLTHSLTHEWLVGSLASDSMFEFIGIDSQ